MRWDPCVRPANRWVQEKQLQIVAECFVLIVSSNNIYFMFYPSFCLFVWIWIAQSVSSCLSWEWILNSNFTVQTVFFYFNVYFYLSGMIKTTQWDNDAVRIMPQYLQGWTTSILTTVQRSRKWDCFLRCNSRGCCCRESKWAVGLVWTRDDKQHKRWAQNNELLLAGSNGPPGSSMMNRKCSDQGLFSFHHSI